MTATVLAFPCAIERDDNELQRTGSSSYTRTIDEAEALWDILAFRVGSDITGQVEAFARQVDRLAAQRPEVAGDRIALGSLEVELVALPAFFRAAWRSAIA